MGVCVTATRAPGSDVSGEAAAPAALPGTARVLSDSWKARVHAGLTGQRSASEGAFSFMKGYLTSNNGDHCGRGQFKSGFRS